MKKNTLRTLFTSVLVATFVAASLAGGGQAAESSAAEAADTKEEAQTEAPAETTEAAPADTVEVKTIKAATGGGPKPYVYVGDDNQPTGYDIEVLKAVFDLIPEYDLEIEVTDFPSVFAGLNAGSYQIGVNNFSYNEERASSYLYSLPYDKVSYVFVYGKDQTPITSLADAAGLSGNGGDVF